MPQGFLTSTEFCQIRTYLNFYNKNNKFLHFVLLMYNEVAMKEKNNILCPKCGHNEVIKYGKSRDNIQRYKCKKCDKTFMEIKKRVNYSSKEKAFLSMLLNFLDSDCEAISIKDVIENIDESNINTRDFNLITRTEEQNRISCYAPKLLICQEFNKVTIYKISKRLSRNSKSRTITIIDSDENKRIKTISCSKKNYTSLKIFSQFKGPNDFEDCNGSSYDSFSDFDDYD